nr:agamous-like MADS-box protein AGL62 [Ipomoea batatas]
MAARTSRGRQRIEMVKIERKSNLEVTFSKRRIGLFKKASVLSTLCGADIAIIVFSPPAGNKVFSFGHPNVEAVMERFLGEDNPAPVNEIGGGALATEQFVEAQRNARVQELNMELTRLEAVFEFEKKRGKAIDGFVEANREAHGWMRGSYDDLNFQQLVTLKSGMENLLKEIQQKAHHQLMAMHGNGTPFNPYASGVFPTGNMVSGDPTSEFNFGTNGGAAGALPFTSGVPGAHPFTSGGAAGALPFASGVLGAHPSTSGSSSMAGGYNTVSPWVASTSGASNSAGEAKGFIKKMLSSSSENQPMAGASAEETDLLRRSKKKTKRGLSERDNDPMQMEGEDTVDPLSNGNNPANEQRRIPSNTVKRPTVSFKRALTTTVSA